MSCNVKETASNNDPLVKVTARSFKHLVKQSYSAKAACCRKTRILPSNAKHIKCSNSEVPPFRDFHRFGLYSAGFPWVGRDNAWLKTNKHMAPSILTATMFVEQRHNNPVLPCKLEKQRCFKLQAAALTMASVAQRSLGGFSSVKAKK